MEGKNVRIFSKTGNNLNNGMILTVMRKNQSLSFHFHPQPRS